MDRKKIEKAVEHIKSDMQWLKGDSNEPYYQTLLFLAQLFLSVKGIPRKAEIPETRIATPLCEISFNKGRIQGRNQAIDEFTAWLVGRMEGVEEICIRELWYPDLFDDLKIDPLDMDKRQSLKTTARIIATAIKTMVLEGSNE